MSLIFNQAGPLLQQQECMHVFCVCCVCPLLWRSLPCCFPLAQDVCLPCLSFVGRLARALIDPLDCFCCMARALPFAAAALSPCVCLELFIYSLLHGMMCWRAHQLQTCSTPACTLCACCPAAMYARMHIVRL